MFELSDFYEYCRKNRVAVIPYSGMPAPGATVRDGGQYAVFLDFSKIGSTRLLRGVCSHELSHAATGALHRPASPYDLAQRSEYRAKRYFAQHFLTEKDLRDAFSAGFTELWQLAEFFDLPEKDVLDAVNYWVQARGVNFNRQAGES